MRIVHISDIHIGRLSHQWRALFDKRVLGVANWLLRRSRHFHPEYIDQAIADIHRLGPELVVCTGDITCVGAPEEFQRALDILEPLRAAFGHRFLFIPGNHDAYVRDRRCQDALKQAFSQLNSGRWELTDCPLSLQITGLRVLMVDAATPASWLSSTGRLTETTLNWLDQRLTKPREPVESRLLLCHFPTRQADGRPLGARRRMQGATRLIEHLSSGRLDVILSGHVHTAFSALQADGRGEVCAGSLTLNGTFNVVDWNPENGRFSQFFVDVSRQDSDALPVAADLAAVS